MGLADYDGRIILGVVLVTGVVLFIAASGTLSKVGAGMVFLAAAVPIADRMPSEMMGGRFMARPSRTRGGRTPDPQYIATTEAPSEDLWAREQARYRERDERQP